MGSECTKSTCAKLRTQVTLPAVSVAVWIGLHLVHVVETIRLGHVSVLLLSEDALLVDPLVVVWIHHKSPRWFPQASWKWRWAQVH